MDISNEAGDLKNYMENCVDDTLENMLEDIAFTTKICTCDQCKLDIKAIALNSLPQKYVVTKKGELYAKINSLQIQFDVDIITAVTRASAIVGRNPRHG